ncbi:condensation domain-containing protein, partial [Pseudoalteromonas holothuriae]|uniref:condensation domain-containing protein n=1 Tax=Pseudoalteromonas holothuriae TaxID=2963714 RepID=UPI0021BF23A5
SHQHIPFEMLVETLQPERSLAYNPLFQIMFSMQNNDMGSLEPGEDVADDDEITTRFDLEVHAVEEGDVVSLYLNYNLALFESQSIARLADNYEMLLAEVVASLKDKTQ